MLLKDLRRITKYLINIMKDKAVRDILWKARYGSKLYREISFQKNWQRFEEDYINKKLEEYWVNYRYFKEILERFDFKEKKILDVGCGVVSVLNILPEGEKYGIDPLMDIYLKLYDLNSEITWRRASGEYIPFPSNYFDFVFCSNVLDHTREPNCVLQEIKRTLKSQGKLILTVDTFIKPIDDRSEAHSHLFTEPDVKNLIERNFLVEICKKAARRASVYAYMKRIEVDSNNLQSL